MKNLISLIMTVMLSVFSVSAMASQSSLFALQGQTSWGIAKKTCGNGAQWEALGLPLRLMAGVSYVIDPSRCQRSVKASAVKDSVRSSQPTVGGRIIRCKSCEYRHPDAAPFCKKGDNMYALTQQYGFTAEEAQYILANIDTKSIVVTIPYNKRLYRLSFSKNVLWEGVIYHRALPQDVRKLTLPNGKIIYRRDKCCNWLQVSVQDASPKGDGALPPQKTAPVVVAPESPIALPVQSGGDEVAMVQPLSAFPAENELEWELIVGAGVWENNLAHGNWQYAEGALSARLKDGYRLGGGFYGSKGRGSDETSDYAWKERTGFGPQLVAKRNFLKAQESESGTMMLPAGWSLKARYLPNDSVKGGNPGSGYSMSQSGKKYGLYADYAERTSPDSIWGMTAEKWWYRDGKIQSTWSGDTPQDRGSWNVNVYRQERINDDWQVRGIAGASHQDWDKLNFFNLTAEMRYQETVMFGPRLALPLNKPAAYRDVSRGDLVTPGAFVRVELGGVIRLSDREHREGDVQYLGSVTE